MLNNFKMPKTFLHKEKYMSLSPENRKKYLGNLIKELIFLNKGITVSQIMDSLQLSYDAVRRHLIALETIGNIYRVKYGQSEVYFPNGKNLHPEDEIELKFDETIFTFSFLSNQFDDFLLIQEKRIEEKGRQKARGSIMIRQKNIPPFLRTLSKSYKEYNSKEVWI